MARELGDVLHYFLDDDPAPAARPPCPVVAAPCRREDALRTALLWQLALEMRQLGQEPALLAPAPDGERSGWLDLELDTLAPSFVPVANGQLDRLICAVRERRNQLGRFCRPVILVQVPTDLPWPQGTGDLLGHCWLVTGSSDRERAEFLSLAERILSVAPKARVGVTVLGADGLASARTAFDTLTELFEARFDRSLLSYGLVLDELELYRTLVERRSLGVARPGIRAARTLRDVATLLRGDLE